MVGEGRKYPSGLINRNLAAEKGGRCQILAPQIFLSCVNFRAGILKSRVKRVTKQNNYSTNLQVLVPRSEGSS